MNENLIPDDKKAPELIGLDEFVERQKESELTNKVFYKRDDVRELADRLQMMVVGGEKRYSLSQAVTLAQAALAHGLSPFNGEIWLLLDKDGISLGLMIGIKGLRKHAHRQVRRARTRYHIEMVEVKDPKERELLAPQEHYSEKVIIYKSLLMVEGKVGYWIVNLSKLRHVDYSKEEALAMAGNRPETIGIGIYDPASSKERYYWRRGQLAPAQIAIKRAEADALKKEFDVLLAMEYSEEVDKIFGADVSIMEPDFEHDGPPAIEIPEKVERVNTASGKTTNEILAELQVEQ